MYVFTVKKSIQDIIIKSTENSKRAKKVLLESFKIAKVNVLEFKKKTSGGRQCEKEKSGAKLLPKAIGCQ